MKFIDLSGKRFGRLVVIEPSTSQQWLCQCDCGKHKVVFGMNLRAGYTQSCGCLQKERASQANLKHGGGRSPEFKAWAALRGRCNNPTDHRYAYYGGRGIKVCERWGSFENFIADMGPRPTSNHSIDRINNDGNYEPSNCRWATKSEQSKNRRKRNERK